MTIAERNNKLKHFIACLKCEVSGKPCDVNCSTQYDAGNMGEIIENLEAISKALEQEPKTKGSYHPIISGNFQNPPKVKSAETEFIPSITPQEPFINKPCVSGGVCEHDKQKVLDKIRAEMFEEMISHSGTGEEVIQAYADGLKKGLEFIDKYKAETED